MNNLNDSKVDLLTTRDLDFHGRRVRNAGNSISAQDYVTRKELEAASSESVLTKLFNKLIALPRDILTRLISPPFDATNALIISKADRVTPIVTFDTLTPEVNVASTNFYLSKYGVDGGYLNRRANGTLASPTQVLANERIGYWIGTAYHSGSAYANTAGISFYASENQTNTARGSLMQFETVITGATARAVRFKVDGNGDFVIVQNVGFFNATPAAQQTLNAYTTDSEAGAYSGLATALGGTPYAAVSDLNALRTAYENLRASYDDLRAKLKITTLVL